MTDLTLLVGGREYGGWQEVSVTRSMEAVAGSFSVRVSERWAGQDTRWPIRPFDAVRVLMGGHRVVSGYVDSVRPAFDSGQHAVTITGRDKTGDLVDCSAVHSPGEWRGLDLVRLAGVLCKPFGVSVRAAVGVGAAFDVFKLQPGETAWEAIDRAARMRGVLVMSDGAGGLVITRAGQGRATTALVQGANILAASGEYQATERYSDYTVKGQHFGTDELNGEAAATVQATASDSGVPRYRPLVVIAETAVALGGARDRAQWEATVRAARADRVTVTVQGWQQEDGSLWPVNALVNLRSSWLGIDGDMLITGVRYNLGGQGTTTELTLARPDAFTPEPIVGKSGLGNIWESVFRD